MIEIGKKLQKRRLELNLSYEDVSEITKLSLPHLKAIEEGNLDYFKDDLTYVRFYVRSYCKALDVPYENFKDDIVESVEEYTNTITMKKRKKIEQAEKNIAEHRQVKPVRSSNIMRKEVETLLKENKGPKLAKKDLASIHQNAQKNQRFTKKKIDIPMLSLLAVVVIIIGIVLYVGVGSLFNQDTEKPGGNDTPIVDKTPTPESDVNKDPVVDKDEQKDETEDTDISDDETKDESDEALVAKIVMENANTYAFTGIKAGENVKIEVVFLENQCWFDGTFNYAPLPNDRAGKIYGPFETYTVENVAGNADMYELKFGYFPGTQVKVNGVNVELDPSLALAGNVQTIYIYVRGE